MNSPASISPQSQAETRRASNSESAPARGCVAVITRAHASALAVCKAGQLVALHFATEQGEIIITLSEFEFNARCRGLLDHNGNLFAPLRVESPGSRVESMGEKPVRDNSHCAPKATRNSARAASVAAARDEWLDNPTASLTECAAKHGLSGPSTLRESLIKRVGLAEYQTLSYERGHHPRKARAV